MHAALPCRDQHQIGMGVCMGLNGLNHDGSALTGIEGGEDFAEPACRVDDTDRRPGMDALRGGSDQFVEIAKGLVPCERAFVNRTFAACAWTKIGRIHHGAIIVVAAMRQLSNIRVDNLHARIQAVAFPIALGKSHQTFLAFNQGDTPLCVDASQRKTNDANTGADVQHVVTDNAVRKGAQ